MERKFSLHQHLADPAVTKGSEDNKASRCCLEAVCPRACLHGDPRPPQTVFEEHSWFKGRPPYRWWLFNKIGAVNSQLVPSDLKRIWNVELYWQLATKLEINIFFLFPENITWDSIKGRFSQTELCPCSRRRSLTHHSSWANVAFISTQWNK